MLVADRPTPNMVIFFMVKFKLLLWKRLNCIQAKSYSNFQFLEVIFTK